MTCVLDITAPTINTPSSDEGAVSADRTLDFSWTASTDSQSDMLSLEICIDSDKADACDHSNTGLAGTATAYQWADEPNWRVTYYAKIRATDNVGNVSAWSSWSAGVMPDGIPPTLNADNADTSSWFTENPTITVTATDAESGLNKVTYSWDSAADTNSTETSNGAALSIPSEGVHALYLWAVDNAENEQTWSGVYWLDTIEPTIDAGAMALDNSYVEITFNEAVYMSLGSGVLEVTDFALTFVANGGTATGAVITGLTKTDGTALAGGESVVRAQITVTGLPAGTETVEIKPTDGTSIYDIAGNTALITETTGALTLRDTTYLAFEAVLVDPTSTNFSDFMGVEFIAGAYTNVVEDDTNYENTSTFLVDETATQLFLYNTNAITGTVNRLSFHIIAAATAEAGNGVTAKIWNDLTGTWEAIDTNTDGAMGTTALVYDSAVDVENYIDDSGIVRVLVYSTNPATAGQNAVLSTDWAYRRLWNEINIGLQYFDGVEVIDVAIEPTEIGENSPLRIHKGGVNYGISLVDSDDPYASKMQSKTANDGVKAWLKWNR